ncbi:MurR/RpiR family transcriptional regulator [Microbacterium sp. PRC9]|uniref:MurR/RpiR family transcriptional regulator n=1 Tax=Microbacterium sp. PRC9 TaxID=2962591 RepID=UPI002882585F|nr:MurR/RpiR family transcriptional regulator [Microbacterium sp. PRC9]MDT0144518.1 MurR/RpiR family transcriptional regulator [Microbacterium sp. PRC9]
MPTDRIPPLLERLSNARPSLRRSEAKVLDLVMTDPRLVVDSTMAGVAAAADVSEPTVMRFSTSLGFDGFQQFRLALAEALALGLPAGLSTIGTDDDAPTLTAKIFDHTLSSLDRARSYLDPDAVDRAVAAILESTSIVLIGHGASAVIAMDAAQKSVLFGVPCVAPDDPHQWFMSVAMASPETLVVAISNTGSTRSVLEIVQHAHDRRLRVVALTGSDDTPLARLADIALVVKTFENTDLYTPTVSRLAGLVVVDILATAVAVRRGEAHAQDLARMKSGLTAFRRD